MTIEQMAQRLNIGDDELEVLKAWEQAKTLPMRYLHLRDYLGARILDQQNIEWAEMIRMISNVRRDTPYTPEAMDELHIKLQRLVAALIDGRTAIHASSPWQRFRDGCKSFCGWMSIHNLWPY